MEKQVIILAKSSKHHGHCVGGVEVGTGNWIRLVSEDEETDGALTDQDMISADGSPCGVLDKVTVTCLRENPTDNQPENYLIDRSVPFVKNGVATLEEVLQVPHIRANEWLHNIYANQWPAVEVSEWEAYLNKGYRKYSIVFVEVDNLTLHHVENEKGKKKTKANFEFKNKSGEVRNYKNISITDPDYYETPDGYTIPKAYLIISFPNRPIVDEDSGRTRYYKFIAKIFEPNS